MSGQQGTDGVHTYSDQELAWIGDQLDELRPRATGPHFLYWSLAMGFACGLAAHVAGYLLGASASGEPLGLAADLLYALGGALWTGIVVVLFAQVIPDVKRRQIREAVEAYAAWQRKRIGREGRPTLNDCPPPGSARRD